MNETVVAKLWPDDPSSQVEETVRNVKICKNGRNHVVAATPEKSETYVFDDIKVRDREVGGSNPLAPTKKPQKKRTLRSAFFVFLRAVCYEVFYNHRPTPLSEKAQRRQTPMAVQTQRQEVLSAGCNNPRRSVS